jgi:7,8-dihydroneopterin aldolase/epimerase/oxygenase
MSDDFPDRLSLLGMRFEATHGVLPSEKIDPQPFEVDLVLHADLRDAGRTDALDDTVDYRGLHELVDSIVMGPTFDLIEGLAGAIARAVLTATDPRLVGAVEVRVRKPDAPLPGELDTVEAALVRRRPEVATD